MSTGYGSDVWCLDSLQPGRIARGVNLVVQALYGRMITSRGTLRGTDEAAVYGYDVAEMIGAVGYPAALKILPAALRAEFLKDDRVSGAVVTVYQVTDAAGNISLTIETSATLHDSGETFAFTVSATDVTTQLLGVL